MYLSFQIEPYRISKTTKVANELGNRAFNALIIGKDSYIVNATVETGLDMDGKLDETGGVYNLQMGKYSSMAEDILFAIDLNHDYCSVSQNCIREFKDKKIPIKLKRKGQILIENDVWIGHGATIMGGVTIHNGAVVAANSTVTKDVPPYAIVAGNPARIVKYRFSEEIIEKLQMISWWNWAPEVIAERYEDFAGAIEEFTNKYYEDAKKKFEAVLQEESPVNQMSDGLKYLIIPDFEDVYPVYPKIIKNFCERFNETDAQLVIYLEARRAEKGYDTIVKYLNELQEYSVFVQILDGTVTDVASTIANVDIYVTDRNPNALYYVELAEKYGKKIIAGVDIPIFE